MRTLIIISILISNIAYSQINTEELKFDTKYYKAVDKWVAFPKQETDSAYVYGFIYLDSQAGFTFNYEAKFQITNNRLKKIATDTTVGFVKYRLKPNTSLVSILTEEQISELKLPKQPKWLRFYKEGSGSVSYLKDIGYHYNHVGASNLALEPLTKAYKINPHYKGLEFELAYAYNVLKQFDKAISILEKAIKNNPNNYSFYRELGYALINTEKIKKAEKIYRKGIEIAESDFEKSEMAVNMAQAYFHLRNRDKFDEWAKITRKYAEKGSRYAQFIDLFEQKWNEK